MEVLALALILVLSVYALVAAWPAKAREDDQDACHYERFEQ